MLVDGVRYDQNISANPRTRAIAAFVELIERKLGLVALRDLRSVPFGRADLAEQFRLGKKLIELGVIRGYGMPLMLPDEPPFRLWSCRMPYGEDTYAGGASIDSDKDALTAALAEAIERYVWYTQRDYFVRSQRCSSREMAKRHAAIMPERFAGFSEEQRAALADLTFSPDASYLWIEGVSLVTGKRTYIPAQTASAAVHPLQKPEREPLIRTQTTIGLATWPTLDGARLAGALECIEREAYMVLWFNQLTLPRAKLSSVRARSASLEKIIERCERYGFKVHLVPMLTDAPTHAICAVLEDESGVGPRFALGLKAHRSFARAAEHAILEALRARRVLRSSGDAAKAFDPSASVGTIGHLDRLFYWQSASNAKRLEFLVAGEDADMPEAAWEHDSAQQHLARVIAWCREKKFECVSVSLGGSRVNPMPWKIEMVIMPELQPTHLSETFPHLGGKRLKEVPRMFGYEPLETPYIAAPHPYY